MSTRSGGGSSRGGQQQRRPAGPSGAGRSGHRSPSSGDRQNDCWETGSGRPQQLVFGAPEPTGHFGRDLEVDKEVPRLHLRLEPGRKCGRLPRARRIYLREFRPRVEERVRKFGFSAGNSSSGSRFSSRGTRATARNLADSKGKTESRAGKRRSRAERSGRREPGADEDDGRIGKLEPAESI